MTKHEQNMEVYATEILNTIQAFARIFIAAADAKDWASTPQLIMAKSDLKRFLEAPNKITEARNQTILSEKPCSEEKYLQLYKDSEDMYVKCARVVNAMCFNRLCNIEEIDENDVDIVKDWSVVKGVSGVIWVTVDYVDDNDKLQTYQFPAKWLDYTTEQLEHAMEPILTDHED